MLLPNLGVKFLISATFICFCPTQSRINAASQVFRSLKKSVFTSNHVDFNSKLHFYSCLVLSRLTYGAAESWALTGSLPQRLHAPHDGPVPGRRRPLHS